jgi:PKD repeat protein
VANQISTLDTGYTIGDLSFFPEKKDNKASLYEAKNEAVTNLRQSMTFNSKFVIVEDTSSFPPNGILHIGKKPGEPGAGELIWYSKKTNTVFKDLIRGFAGSRQSYWPAGSPVTSGVMAEHHNAIKDAILKIQRNLGLDTFPNEASLNGILTRQENRFLAPKPSFTAYPTKGAPALKVRFQNFTTGNPIRYLWDFGDGSTSVEKSPIHTYLAEGVYTVRLNIITGTGAQGIATKSNYITVNNEQKTPFFYVLPAQGDSIETAFSSATTFSFVDQTDGAISERYWIFGDGQTLNVTDPNVHTATHQYEKPGTYETSLMIIFANQSLKRVFLVDKITVF